MIKVKVKLKYHKQITVPVPYFLLRTGVYVISSRMIWSFIHRMIEKSNMDVKEKAWIPTSIDRKDIRALLKAVKQYRGLTIVEVQDKEGTEIVVKL
ncbi:hypothetical protein BGM26_20630 [Bacillus sp. FJAT-29790]|uniref:hypothetical protein n=1 Tax=Bacillus sp. FJAT-29790 TaxID=1895002 RepID=UPI001C2155FC|nr:hypothetical protein [Bacillus sp. FJAT-29790]MBU8881328.1 hypothetical protein [Bacillus sp. FJAT-29790]